MSSRFRGILAAPFTPFHADGSLNLDVIALQCEKLVADGVAGAFVCGSTGEGASLGLEERKAVARRWVEVAQGRLKVIVHVGHTSVTDAAALAADAQAAGADATSALGPFYFKPATVDHLIDFLAPVAAAAADLPFFYYHIPTMTGVAHSMVALLERAPERIPNFAGLKFTDSDLTEYTDCLAFDGGRFDVLWGRDEWMLPALSVGAQGFIGSTYNYSTPLYLRLRAAFEAGDTAQAAALSETVMAAVRALLKTPGVPGGKAIMAACGVPVGPPRPPLRAITNEQATTLVTRLEDLGALATC